jgi:hypothetical protein
MHRIFYIAVLALVTNSPVAFSQSPTPHVDSVWFWSGACPKGKRTGVEILVEGKAVYRSSFRACRLERTDAVAKNEGGTRVFHFSGGHDFQNTYPTTKRESIEGNLWQAGADTDDILLGVSFTAHNQILLNTIHVAKLGEPSSSTLDSDVVIKTYPIRN